MNEEYVDTLMDDVESETSDISMKEYDITASPNDFNVMTIGSFMDSGAIVIPPYQRNYTWDKRRASKLIESLLLGLPVPQLFLYEEERNKFAILDGQQRLMSLYFFQKGRFPKREHRALLRETFSEKGVFENSVLANNEYFSDFTLDLPSIDGSGKSRFDGEKYLTLGDSKSSFDLRTIRCVLIKQNAPNDDNSSIFEIFDRLNTGGVNLKPQEIRANLYYSPFYQMIYDLNKNKSWRQIFGDEIRDLNLRDVELILRAFALLVDSENYSPSMTRFLNRFSSKMKKNKDSVNIYNLKEIFVNFCDAVLEVDGAASFQANDRFSIGLFESAFYAYCVDSFKHGQTQPIQPVELEKLQKIRTAAQYYITYASAQTRNVEGRLNAGKAVITGG